MATGGLDGFNVPSAIWRKTHDKHIESLLCAGPRHVPPHRGQLPQGPAGVLAGNLRQKNLPKRRRAGSFPG